MMLTYLTNLILRGMVTVAVAVALLVQMPNAMAQPLSSRQTCHAVSAPTCDLAHALGRGINMGNMLEAPRKGDWGIRLNTSYINLVAEKFETVRVPVRWTNHAAPTEDAKLDEFFAARVD
jgi:endoglucanase